MSTLYALHVTDTKQHIAGLVYAGAAIVAALAGDLVTLFVAWELTALSSVVLIWASNNEASYKAGMRYLIIQVGSGRAAAVGGNFALLRQRNRIGDLHPLYGFSPRRHQASFYEIPHSALS